MADRQTGQPINLKMNFRIDEEGYMYNGKIGPHVDDHFSTPFGGGGPEYNPGFIEDRIMEYRETAKEHYPDRPFKVFLTFK